VETHSSILKERERMLRFMANKKAKAAKSSRSLLTRIYVHRGFYLMFIPVFIFVLLFNYWPMLGIRFAFTKYVSGSEPIFNGLDNIRRLVVEEAFWKAFVNTLELSIIKLLLNTGMAVIISLLLNEIGNVRFKKITQTIIYLPHFMSWVVTASIFKLILSPTEAGLVNTLLLNLGIIESGEEIYFLNSAEWWRTAYYFINIWRDTGWGTIIFLATLSGINPELYEAAHIDGANRWSCMRFITLPSLANTIITVLILNLAKIMNLFESVFVLLSPGGVKDVGQVLQTYTYDISFPSGGSLPDFGFSTAVGLFRSIISCILVVSCNKLSKIVRGRGIV